MVRLSSFVRLSCRGGYSSWTILSLHMVSRENHTIWSSLGNSLSGTLTIVSHDLVRTDSPTRKCILGKKDRIGTSNLSSWPSLVAILIEAASIPSADDWQGRVVSFDIACEPGTKSNHGKHNRNPRRSQRKHLMTSYCENPLDCIAP